MNLFISYKMELYQYIDIINPKDYLALVEKKANEQDKWSWEVILDDINDNIIDTDCIFNFKKQINESIKKLDLYEKNMKYNKIQNEHNKNMLLFWDLQNTEINKMILIEKHEHFLNFYKNIYEKIKIMYNILSKIQLKDINKKQKSIFINMFKDSESYYKCLINILIKYYKSRNATPTDIFFLCKNINVLDLKNISLIKYSIENNIKVYENVRLPKKIIEKIYKPGNLSKNISKRKLNNIFDYDMIVFVKHIMGKLYFVTYAFPGNVHMYILYILRHSGLENNSYNFKINIIISWKEMLSWILLLLMI